MLTDPGSTSPCSVTLAASLAFLALGVICTLWFPDVNTHAEGNRRWVDVAILISIATSFILFLIAIFKLVFGRGDLFARPEEYQEIEDDGTPHLGFLSPRLRLIPALGTGGITPIGTVLWPESTGGDKYASDAPAKAAAREASLQGAGMGTARSNPALRAEPHGELRVSFQKPLHGGGDVLRPFEEDAPRNGEIDAGIELERSNHEFLHNGLHFAAGTWRVLNVRKESCCDRQGTCGPGDIIVSLNGVNAEQADKRELVSLLRGMPGASISVEVIHVDCRHAVKRQLILAPSPSDLGISARLRS